MENEMDKLQLAAVASWLAIKTRQRFNRCDLEDLERIFDESTPIKEAPKVDDNLTNYHREILARFQMAMAKGEKITAIKEWRHLTEKGLIEAKTDVESMIPPVVKISWKNMNAFLQLLRNMTFDEAETFLVQVFQFSWNDANELIRNYVVGMKECLVDKVAIEAE